MKSSTFFLTACAIIFSLTLVSSCEKYDTPPPPPCSTCPTPTTNNRSVNLQVSNWTTNGDGFYRADFSDALKQAAGDYNDVLKVYVETESTYVEIGISTSIPGGTISHYGTLLIFKTIGYGQTVFSPFRIKVLVD
jgi:hypothetical protein